MAVLNQQNLRRCWVLLFVLIINILLGGRKTVTLEIDICSPLFQLIINSQNMNIKGLGRHRLSDSRDGDEEVAL